MSRCDVQGSTDCLGDKESFIKMSTLLIILFFGLTLLPLALGQNSQIGTDKQTRIIEGKNNFQQIGTRKFLYQELIIFYF